MEIFQKKNAHLIFRQSSSLIEKLFTLWLSICLYDDVKENLIGSNLFMLYKALKCQIDKGPVDSITGNARYSLNEHKLLREPVDVKQMQLLIVPLDNFDESPILVRCLTCDTISQLKMKLLDAVYKNEPFSKRISTDHFDLDSTTQSTNTTSQMTASSSSNHYYHLECASDKLNITNKIDQSIPKSIPEVFLTRLLTR
ncbi:unnamed protein product [Anisakis simplex]|uniref:Plexin-2 (inferred by orthology to a C. elegans protein) n=1 Tax=Anisakis simplex TaxID=6269 RepID=A0A0M3KF71_ANISI|nr:unnamed protein product [Anisakis simplex]